MEFSQREKDVKIPRLKEFFFVFVQGSDKRTLFVIIKKFL